MQNFQFQNQTKVIFGKDTESTIGKELKPFADRILLHYGGGSIKKSGLYDRVVNSLNEAGVEFVELDGVMPNPRISLARKGIELCREHDLKFILAIGGGSVIDSAKAIASGVGYEGDVWDLFMEGARPKYHLPLATVLTIPAAGSETSPSCVLTNEVNNLKRPYWHPDLRPVFSILNPELTFTLPDYQTACGIADMFAHVIERYFTNEKNVNVTDHLCEATMKAIVENGSKLMRNPDSYELRAEVMLAGMVAHNDSLEMGRIGDWSSHDLEHELSGFYDIAHGAGLAIIIPAWMKYVYKHDVARFARFGSRVFNLEVNTENLAETALRSIAEVERFFEDIGFATRMSEAGLPVDEIDELAKSLLTNKTHIGNFVKIFEEDARQIYTLAI